MRVRESVPLRGLVLAALIGTAFAANSTLAALAAASGSNMMTVLALRATVAFIALFLMLGRQRVPRGLPVPRRWQALGLGLLFASYSWMVFASFQRMPVALAVVTFYTYPLMVAGYAWWRGWERFSPASASAFLLAFAGIVLALDVFGARPDGLGICMALASAVIVSVVLTLSPRVRGSGDSRPVTLHMLGVAAGLYTVALVTLGNLAWPTTAAGWAAFLAAPVFYTFAIVTLFQVLALIGPSRMALIMNVEPVAAVLLGYALLDQVLAQIQLFGVALVIAAVALIELARYRTAARNLS